MFSNGATKAKLTALEVMTARVMIADNSGNITYLNEALTDFFKGKEEELRKHFPEFSADKLVGMNFDKFQTDPSQQRNLMAALADAHKTTISIGDFVFDLAARPLHDKAGKRIGTVLEWRDAELRLQNEDYSAQLAAIHNAQAVIRFKPDGTIVEANENFLAATGYRQDEIVGKHHRIFCDADFVASHEYAEFWPSLARGEFKAGDHKRIHKNGDVLWLQATYNPVRDTSGDVTSVVKFAVDISEQKQRTERVAQAQVQIASDVSGIAQAVSTASEQSRSSASASEGASSNVQSVSVGIEELVSSVAEINRRVEEANAITVSAVKEAETTTQTVAQMSEAAQEIENVVNLISDIAEQTNLLALNATIEAARAGEAGRGFAVVAAEVKELANQTGKATSDISASISNVQKTSVDVVEAIGTISKTINTISEISIDIKAAISQQSATTTEMSSNMHVAATDVQAINEGIRGIADSLDIIQQSTDQLQQAASNLA
ncbi:MAG: PAS domain-containing methyl-accepting chemotaxis protein [Pseudomonadota bacterium]